MEALKTINNGEKVRGIFSTIEMNRRLRVLRDHIADDSIDAVLFTSIHSISYFSDFLYCTFGRPCGLVVTDQSRL